MKTLLIVLCIGLGNLLLTIVLLWMILCLAWRPIARRWPGRPPADDAVQRNFQSYRIGLLNLGYCVHTAVDEEYLHLVPASAIRWLGGRPVSVPWSAISVSSGGRGARTVNARLGELSVRGPAWALELAAPPQTEGNDATSTSTPIR